MPDKKNYTGEELCNLKNQLKTNSSVFISEWDTCRFFYKPQTRADWIFTNNVPSKRVPQATIGMRAKSILSSGLYSNTINLSDDFFSFTITDKQLAEDNNIKDYFAKCTEIAVEKLAASNYALSTFETIDDYVVVGNGVQYSEMSKETKQLRFQNFMINHVAIAENPDGKVDTVFRNFEMTAAQAYAKWGDKCPSCVKEAYESVESRYDNFKFFHAAFPRQLNYKDGESRPVPGDLVSPENMKYCSYYVFEKDKEIIEEGGYNTFPYAVCRFQKNQSNNPSGRSCSYDGIGSMQALSNLIANLQDGIELKVNPPVFMPPGASDQSDIDLTPGAYNFYDPMWGTPQFYQSDIDLGAGLTYKEILQKEVMEIFYADLFLMLEERKNMTATEVAERVAEKVQSILPVVSRLYDELYSPTLVRVFYILLESNAFPPMPEELREVWGTNEIRVSYQTKLDNKLKQLELGQVVKTLQELALVYETKTNFPDIEASIKIDQLAKEIPRLNNVSPDVIKSDKETDLFYEAKAEAEQAAQQQMAIDSNTKPLDLQAPIAPHSIYAQTQNSLGGQQYF